MAEIPSFKGEQPVFTPVEVNTKSKSFDEFARQFGQAAKQSEEGIVNIEDAQSKAQFMTASTSLQDLTTNTQIAYLKDPGNTPAILQGAKYTADTIKQAAYVNKADRAQLNYITDQHMNQLTLKSAEVNKHQQEKTIATTLFGSLENVVNQITDAVTRGDMKTAKILVDNFHANAQAAAMSDAISPSTFGRMIAATAGPYNQVLHAQGLLDNPDATAKDYHSVYSSPFNPSPVLQGMPVDEHTATLANIANTSRSYQAASSALINGHAIPWGGIATATDHQMAEFEQQAIGVRDIKAMIRSNTPYQQIDAHVVSLANKTDPTIAEKAAVSHWEAFNKNLATTNGMYGYLGQTVLGQEYASEHDMQGNAIMSAPIANPALRAEQLRQNDNMYMGKMIDLAHSLGVPHEFIKPLAAQYVQEFRSSFQKNADPMLAINRLEYLNPELRAYSADIMPKPHQGMTLLTCGYTLNNPDVDRSFCADLIVANQDTVSPLQGGTKSNGEPEAPKAPFTIDTSDKESKSKSILSSMLSDNNDMKNVFAYLGVLPNGPQAQAGFSTMFVNYAYNQASRSGDQEFNNRQAYTDTFVKNVSMSMRLHTTQNGVIEMGTLGLSRPQDADLLIQHSLSEAYKALHVGRTDQQLVDFVNNNPLKVVSLPDKRIVVLDRSNNAVTDLQGHPAFEQVYNPRMLTVAQANLKAERAAIRDVQGSDLVRAGKQFLNSPTVRKGIGMVTHLPNIAVDEIADGITK